MQNLYNQYAISATGAAKSGATSGKDKAIEVAKHSDDESDDSEGKNEETFQKFSSKLSPLPPKGEKELVELNKGRDAGGVRETHGSNEEAPAAQKGPERLSAINGSAIKPLISKSKNQRTAQ